MICKIIRMVVVVVCK